VCPKSAPAEPTDRFWENLIVAHSFTKPLSSTEVQIWPHLYKSTMICFEYNSFKSTQCCQADSANGLRRRGTCLLCTGNGMLVQQVQAVTVHIATEIYFVLSEHTESGI
jgi:hypothetical protein